MLYDNIYIFKIFTANNKNAHGASIKRNTNLAKSLLFCFGSGLKICG